MTKEEAIWWVNHLFEICKEEYFNKGMIEDAKEVGQAQHMAIEALSEQKTIIAIDIPYGSDEGLATVFKSKDDKLILEEVKEIMSIVRCKNCEYQNECEEVVLFDINDDEVMGHRVHWCSYGRSKK